MWVWIHSCPIDEVLKINQEFVKHNNGLIGREREIIHRLAANSEDAYLDVMEGLHKLGLETNEPKVEEWTDAIGICHTVYVMQIEERVLVEAEIITQRIAEIYSVIGDEIDYTNWILRMNFSGRTSNSDDEYWDSDID